MLGINSLRTQARHETQRAPIELKALLYKYVMLACKVDAISAGLLCYLIFTRPKANLFKSSLLDSLQDNFCSFIPRSLLETSDMCPFFQFRHLDP
jgi:hypothetical protein